MRFDDELARGRLAVAVCDKCQGGGGGGGGRPVRAWPPSAGACPGCLGPVRWARLPPCGRIVEFSRAADGRPFCLAEFAHGVRLLGMLLAPRGGGGGGDPSGLAPRVSQRVVLESCSLGADGRPRYVMRAAGGEASWPPHSLPAPWAAAGPA